MVASMFRTWPAVPVLSHDWMHMWKATHWALRPIRLLRQEHRIEMESEAAVSGERGGAASRFPLMHSQLLWFLSEEFKQNLKRIIGSEQ